MGSEKKQKKKSRWGKLAAMVLACTVLLHVQAASAELIQVSPGRSCHSGNTNLEIHVQLPKLCDPQGGRGEKEISRDLETVTDKWIRTFCRQHEQGSRGFLSVDYQVVTNTDRWFTLKLEKNEIAASSWVSARFYHIDRATGQRVQLGDLFCDKNFGARLRQEIQKQSDERFEGYEIPKIGYDHNFYFSPSGDLVIPFDQYTIAPGAAGSPEFTISKDVIRDILKPQYRS